MMADYANGLEADYWDDDPDAESLTHKTLSDAVEFYVEQECGAAPSARTYVRPTITAPPGYVIAQVDYSSEEIRIAAKLMRSQEAKDRKVAFLECLRVLSRRSFFAWKRSAVDQTMISSIASDLAGRTLEVGLEEMLSPDGLRPCDKALQHRLEVEFVAVLRDQLVHGEWRPWNCEQVGQVTLTAVQMEAMMREHCPHWF